MKLFEGLSADELDEMLHGARSSRYRKDTAIFEQGAEAETFFFLVSGLIRVVHTTLEGDQIVARYIAEGEMFGIAVALGFKAYPASAVAAIDCAALAWPNSYWPKLTARFPSFVAKVYQTVGNRLQETQARVIAMSTEQIEQRIAQALLRLLDQSGRQTEEGLEIAFPITRQDIAELTGTTLYSVSRLISAWEAAGIVRGGRRRIIVVEPRSLLAIAEKKISSP